MIYLDNAATTRKKPQAVIEAVTEALCSMGNAGRGSHTTSLGAARTVFDARQKICELFNGESPSCVAFTPNATASLNIAIKGLIEAGDHVITTQLEHNSVLRPLFEMEDKGVELTILSSDEKGLLDYSQFEASIKENTKAIVCTHGSNLTGNLVDIKGIGKIAKEHNVLFIVDASQTAGVFDIDVQEMNIDVLCFTGHKGLLGPQGTGGLVVKEGVEIKPLLSGGSGIKTYSRSHPKEMPTALEAGTLNAHGLAGLAAAVEYLQETGLSNIRQKEQALMKKFYEGVKDIIGVKVYGDFDTMERCAIVSLNIWDEDSGEVSDALAFYKDIHTRAGGHCAPLMHQALGTVEQGAVRFSFSYENTEEDVEAAIAAIKEIANREE
ncbi:MAG: aminotransferase class V-fold PLP-dependent enzyme [Firmicutes bacterium]|nr:aminotransferase class V-fold PLP-dependent enzyme [Bacillota bacterium]